MRSLTVLFILIISILFPLPVCADSCRQEKEGGSCWDHIAGGLDATNAYRLENVPAISPADWLHLIGEHEGKERVMIVGDTAILITPRRNARCPKCVDSALYYGVLRLLHTLREWKVTVDGGAPFSPLINAGENVKRTLSHEPPGSSERHLPAGFEVVENENNLMLFAHLDLNDEEQVRQVLYVMFGN